MTRKYSVFCLLLACVVFILPLPMGGNRPMTWMPTMLAFYLLTAVWLIAYWRGTVNLTDAFVSAMPVCICLACLLLWMAIQLALPEPYGTWDVHATIVQLHKTMMYLCIFCLVLLIVRTQSELELLCWALLSGGVIQVLIKLVTDEPGTFVNRNHFAGYLEMSISVALGLMIARLSPDRSPSWRESLRRWLKTLLSLKILIRILIIVLVIGLILSRSRMGNTAFFLSLLIAGLIGLIAFRRFNRNVAVFFVSIIVVDVVLMGAFFGIGKLQERFEELNVEQDARLFQSELTVGMIEQHWLTGTGAGSYYTVAPFYRDHRIPGFYDHAHNDLLEIPVELGAPGALLMLGIVGYSLFFAVMVQVRRRHQFMKAMGFASTMGIIALLIHSSADFNLQLTSNAGTFMVLLAVPFLAWTIDRSSKRRDR